jgi:hypothetical protein
LPVIVSDLPRRRAAAACAARCHTSWPPALDDARRTSSTCPVGLRRTTNVARPSFGVSIPRTAFPMAVATVPAAGKSMPRFLSRARSSCSSTLPAMFLSTSRGGPGVVGAGVGRVVSGSTPGIVQTGLPPSPGGAVSTPPPPLSGGSGSY